MFVRNSTVPLVLVAVLGYLSNSEPAVAQMYSPDYTVSSSTVTGSGTSSSAYFTGAAGAGYDVTVQSGANLSTSTNAGEIQLDHGTVSIQSGASLSSSVLGLGGNVADGAVVYITGTGNITSTVNNAGNITINQGSVPVIFIFGNGIVNNTGTMSADGDIFVVGNAAVTNSGTIDEGFYNPAIALGNSGGYTGINPVAPGTGGPMSATNSVSGLITGTGEAYAYGIVIYNSSDGTASNAGTIYSNGYPTTQGITFSGVTSGTILNSGSITSVGYGPCCNAYGVLINGSSSNISDMNTGTITVSGNGYNFGEAVLNSTNITINNSNLMNVSTTGTDAYGIYVDGTSSNVAIANTGTIEASGGSTESSGVHTVAGSTGVTVNNNGGTITGSNYGVYLGGNSSGVTSTTGGVIQGGTDAIALAGTYDTVTIGGQSHIAGTIEGNADSHGTPLTGDTLNFYLSNLTHAQIVGFQNEISSAGSGAGSYTIGGDNYAWDSFGSVHLVASMVGLSSYVDPGLGTIAARMDGFAIGQSRDYDAFYLAAVSNPQAALNSLTGRQVVSSYRSLRTAEMSSLGQLGDSRVFNARSGEDFAEDSGSPQTGGPILMASLGDTMNDANGSLFAGRTRSPWSAWLSMGVTQASASSALTGPGYHTTAAGPTGGIDYRLSPEWSVGGMFHVQSSDTHFEDGSRSDLQGVLVGLDASWLRGPWFVNAMAGAGTGTYDNQRLTLNGSTASSTPGSTEILANVSGGYDVHADGLHIAPIAGLQYGRVGIDSYNEADAGAYDLSVSGQTINSLQSKIGVNGASDIVWGGANWTPTMEAAWYHELLNPSRNVTESLGTAADLSGFNVSTAKPDRDYGIIGVGLEVNPMGMKRDVTLSLNVNAQIAHDYLARTIFAGVKAEF